MDRSETVSDDVVSGEMMTRAHSILELLLHAAISVQDVDVIDKMLKPWVDLGTLMQVRGVDPEGTPASAWEDRAAADERTPTDAGETLLGALAEYERLYKLWRGARQAGTEVDEGAVREAVEEVFEAAAQIRYYRRMKGD